MASCVSATWAGIGRRSGEGHSRRAGGEGRAGARCGAMQDSAPATPGGSAAAGLGSGLRPGLMLLLVCGGFSLQPAFLRTFWTPDYLQNIPQQAATNIILAVGMTFVILAGGIDLSVASVMALCGV